MPPQTIKLIAELGINHDGQLAIARQLIEAAARAGIWGVKFQYRNLENSYATGAAELGDEIVGQEIRKHYLAPAEITGLALHAAGLGLRTGISFFDVADMDDFADQSFDFDFYKVPSVELLNRALIDRFIGTGKQTLISTGAHTEAEIALALGRLSRLPNWTPLHCVSNYPARMTNARLAYIDRLRRAWGREVGYSSHDERWEVCLLAMARGATVIERHITHDRAAPGLDHSTSSLPSDFAVMAEFAHNMPELLAGDSDRFPNQGELLNLQNLGRSYYAARALPAGHTLMPGDVKLRAPRVGLGPDDLDEFSAAPLRRNIAEGEVLNVSAFLVPRQIESDVIDIARKLRLALPVRLHDLATVRHRLPVGTYEFHLSFGEVLNGLGTTQFDQHDRFSVHLPDYISSTHLIDPFAEDPAQQALSQSILAQTAEFVKRLQELTGATVPLVGSFSVAAKGHAHYFAALADLVARYRERGVRLMPQWLPPIAWYFGGSVPVDVINSQRDVDPIVEHGLDICMDVCHLMMGDSYFGFDAIAVMNKLADRIGHLHIADTAGVDGEGIEFGHGDPENIQILRRALEFDLIKVVEVWQGHLDEQAGFAKALRDIKELYLGA